MQDLKVERAEEAASNLDESGSEELQSLDDAGDILPLEEDGELGFVLFQLASFPGFVQLQRMQL